jgi:AAA domain
VTKTTVVVPRPTAKAVPEKGYQRKGADAPDGSATIDWTPLIAGANGPSKRRSSNLKIPTLKQLLASTFKDRQHLLFPWLREQESCMVYAAAGVGKSMFALSAALAIAGGGMFLGWKSDDKKTGNGWRVLYVDGEMHIGDIQERARLLLDAVPGLNREMVGENLSFLARQHQEPLALFPSITEPVGMTFMRERVTKGPFDLVILDNFSTLGEVEDENAASSFNAIQQFLLNLKVQGVATMLVHHANKTGEDFRGSSKLAATFETIIMLERLKEETEHGAAQFRVRWDKVRAGGPSRKVQGIVAKLVTEEQFNEPSKLAWDYEAEGLERLDEIKAGLISGEFINQKEIADFCGVSKPMAKKYLDKGLKVGIWTQDNVSRWFAKGKHRRDKGHTEPPVRPSSDWLTEILEPDEAAGAAVPYPSL